MVDESAYTVVHVRGNVRILPCEHILTCVYVCMCVREGEREERND